VSRQIEPTPSRDLFSTNMNAFEFPGISQGISILGSEYCSGYIDSVGKWNTGFYCPSSSDFNGDGGDVFCCGTEHHKYCCTSTPQDTVQVEQVESVTVLIGVMVGAATSLLLIIIMMCVCCPWCSYYRKKKQMDSNKALPNNNVLNIHVIEEYAKFSQNHHNPISSNYFGMKHNPDLPPAYNEHFEEMCETEHVYPESCVPSYERETPDPTHLKAWKNKTRSNIVLEDSFDFKSTRF